MPSAEEILKVTSPMAWVTGDYEKTLKSAKSTYVGSSNIAHIDDYSLAKVLSPYSFRFGPGPTTYAEVLQQAFALNKEDYEANKALIDSDQQAPPIQPASTSKPGMLNGTIMKRFMVEDDHSTFITNSIDDTSLGGNVAVNCRPAFGRDDDIIHPEMALMGNPDLGGLGRVYAECYQATQQILYISLGVPEFQELWKFYTECVDMNLAGDVAQGQGSWARLFGEVVGGAFKLAIKALNPLTYVDFAANLLDPYDRITRYYELRIAMPMYYRYVNTIVAQLSVTMGFTYNPFFLPNGVKVPYLDWFFNMVKGIAGMCGLRDDKAGTGGSTNGVQGSGAVADLYRQSMDDYGVRNEIKYMNSMPLFMRQHGPNVYDILSKRDYRYDQSKLKMKKITIEDYMESSSLRHRSDGGYFDGWSNRLWSTMCGADKFVGFRINKNADASETFTNSTGAPTIANTINQMAASGRDARFSAGGSLNKFTNLVGSIPGVGAVLDGVANAVKGIIGQFGITGIASAVLTGSGFVDIPDIWTGSSLSKSYNFSFTFRATAGDNATVLQDCYIPLAMILAMACPRSVGQNAYTTPFLLRAYAKGMFGVPLGIIDSLQITRGSSEFGWNMARFPTVIKVNCSIKDLAPIMHMGMTTGSGNFAVFGGATPMQEYMHTLGGLGLQERFLWSSSFIKRLQLSSQLTRSTWLNPIFWATELGSTALFRIAGAINSTSLLGT